MKVTYLVTLIVFTLFFQACSTKEIKQKSHIAYPQYPQKPRIVYLDTYRGGKSKETTSTFALMLGEKSSKTSSARIVKPYGVATQKGKLYVADTGSRSVFVIDMNTSDTKSHLGSGTSGKLANPVSIAFDAEGTTYVSDSREKTIKGFDKDGKYVYVHGGRLEFTHPTGITIDKKLNRLYVVDTKKTSL